MRCDIIEQLIDFITCWMNRAQMPGCSSANDPHHGRQNSLGWRQTTAIGPDGILRLRGGRWLRTINSGRWGRTTSTLRVPECVQKTSHSYQLCSLSFIIFIPHFLMLYSCFPFMCYFLLSNQIQTSFVDTSYMIWINEMRAIVVW